MYERHSLKSGRVFCNRSGRNCNVFQNYGIENNETYKELQKQRKELQKTVTKFKKASGNGEYN